MKEYLVRNSQVEWYTSNFSTQEVEAGRSLSSRPAWSTEFQNSQNYRETLFLHPPKPKQTKERKQAQKDIFIKAVF